MLWSSIFQISNILGSPFPPRWWVSWVTLAPYPPSHSTTFPFPPCTAAWRAPTPSQPAAASALTPSRAWTAWLPPSHTVHPPTAPPATAWTLLLPATSTASTARVSKPWVKILKLYVSVFFSFWASSNSWSFVVLLLSSLNLERLWTPTKENPDLCTLVGGSRHVLLIKTPPPPPPYRHRSRELP